MGKKLSRKERDYLIAKEIAKEKYKKIDELKENGEYEKVEVSNLRGYNKGKFQPITLFGTLFVILIIGMVVTSVMRYNEELSKSGEVELSNIVTITDTIEHIKNIDEYNHEEIKDKKYGEVIFGEGSSDEIKIGNKQKSLEFVIPKYIDKRTLQDDKILIHHYSKERKHLRSERLSVKPHLSEIIYLPEDVDFIKIAMVENIKWEVFPILSDEVIKLKDETKYTLEGNYLLEDLTSCESIIIKPSKELKLDYGIYDENFHYVNKNNDIIKSQVKLYTKFPSKMGKLKASNEVTLYCN